MKIYISGFFFNVYFRTGSLLATTCKDKKLRIIDPRSGEVLRKGDSHQGNKASKVSIYYYMNYHSLKFVHSSEIRGLCLMKCSSKMLFLWYFRKMKIHTYYIYFWSVLLCFACFHQALTPFFWRMIYCRAKDYFLIKKKMIYSSSRSFLVHRALWCSKSFCSSETAKISYEVVLYNDSNISYFFLSENLRQQLLLLEFWVFIYKASSHITQTY